jgi:PAS domain S-box-containing protein
MIELSTLDYQKVFKTAPGLYLVLTPEFIIVAATDKYLEGTMTTREKIIGSNIFEIFPDNPADPNARGAASLLESLNTVLNTGRAHQMAWHRYDICKPDGSYEERYWSPLNTPILNKNGKVDLILHEIEDVTETVKLHSETHSGNEDIRTNALLMRNVSEAVIAIDGFQRIVVWNKFAEKIYGWTAGEAKGKNVSELLAVEYPLNNENEIIQSYRTHGYWKGELIHHNKFGNALDVVVTVSSIRNEPNRVTGILLIIRDITESKRLERKLVQLNERLERDVKSKTAELTAVFERLTDGFIGFDQHFNYIYVNPKMGELLNRDRNELIGKNMLEEYPGIKTANTYKALMKAKNTQQHVWHVDYSVSLKKWLEMNIYPSPDGLSVFIRDVTEKRKMEESLQSVEHTMALIMDSTLEAIVCIDVEDRITIWNPRAEQIFGWKENEVIGKTLTETIIPEQYRQKHHEGLKRYLATGNKTLMDKMIEITALNRAGMEFPIEMTIISIREANKKEFFCAFIHDITERKTAEDQLRTSRDELRQLAAYLQNIREEEQTRIAREIHDEFGQQITGLKMDALWLQKKMPDSPADVKRRLTEMISLLDQTTQSVRKLASSLRPGILDSFGLGAALQWQSAEFEKRFPINVELDIPPDELEISPDMATGLFRLYQEALTNVGRHSGATLVRAALTANKEHVFLTISDNGRGFDIEQIRSKRTLGLLGMKERVLKLNGKLNFDSTAGKGTIVSITVPLSG